LRLVPLSAIELQEEADVGRLERLVGAMRKSGLLKDPPIVTKGLGNKLMQLDGTTRLSALVKLGCSHAIVQYVDYSDSSQVLIKSWVHVSKVDQREFLRRVKQIRGIKTEEFKLGAGLTLTGHPLSAVTIIFRDSTGMGVLANSDLVKRVRVMRAVVDHYSKLITRDREVSLEGREELMEFFTKHKDKNVALFFPSFSAQDIYTLLGKGMVLPQGITRHIVNGRILRINYPLDSLQAKTPGKTKLQFFQNFLKAINLRYYEESTFMVE